MSIPLFELTSFQRDILYVTLGLNRPSGQDLMEVFKEQSEDVTHGRLYPNLDTLVENSYLKKGDIDRRTNFYEVSEMGETALVARRNWENEWGDFDQ